MLRTSGSMSSAGAAASPGSGPPCRPARLPVLALLLGALGLFAAAPAQAQSQIWSATLTVDEDSGYFGCSNAEATQDNCSSSTVLSEDEFTYNGNNYKVVGLYWDSANDTLDFLVQYDPRFPDKR